MIHATRWKRRDHRTPNPRWAAGAPDTLVIDLPFGWTVYASIRPWRVAASDEDREAVPDESHFLRCLVAESLEVYATTFALLTENDPPRVDLAANEVQQAHHRTTAALVQKDGAA